METVENGMVSGQIDGLGWVGLDWIGSTILYLLGSTKIEKVWCDLLSSTLYKDRKSMLRKQVRVWTRSKSRFHDQGPYKAKDEKFPIDMS